MSNRDIHKAVMEHHLQEVIKALSKGEDVDTVDREKRTPLFYACKDGELSIVEVLVQQGADVNAADKILETPLHFAARAYQPAIVAFLLKNGARVDAQDIYGNTPLSRAVYDSRGRGEVINLLISSGANRLLKNKHGVSPNDLADSLGDKTIKMFLT